MGNRRILLRKGSLWDASDTGYIQRVDFVHSNMRGRLRVEERELRDGTAVEAKVLSGGSRSVDVS